MKRDDPNPIRIPDRSAVLLFFMPSEKADRQRRASFVALADSLQHTLGDTVRILKIDELSHPEVVRSFGITQTPAFVLVRQGLEIWRQIGLASDKGMISTVAKHLMMD
ncbi:thioredoxin family protein [Spirosoma sp.]|uniref:thioredoxin family protein n=1 Tax=Spirosoma sp. TaxID=1899569 RepID=UPI002621BD01|nr:thioredoxin family protein [Spirosoma sp.]MCX6217215.1 thioredoxin family protein [Spirosoma sp.]